MARTYATDVLQYISKAEIGIVPRSRPTNIKWLQYSYTFEGMGVVVFFVGVQDCHHFLDEEVFTWGRLRSSSLSGTWIRSAHFMQQKHGDRFSPITHVETKASHLHFELWEQDQRGKNPPRGFWDSNLWPRVGGGGSPQGAEKNLWPELICTLYDAVWIIRHMFRRLLIFSRLSRPFWYQREGTWLVLDRITYIILD